MKNEKSFFDKILLTIIDIKVVVALILGILLLLSLIFSR